MMHTEIAFANDRAIIANMLIDLLTNVRLTYLPDLEPADAHELLLTGAHVLIAQLGSQPTTASEISRVIGRPREVVTQRLDELIERGYVEHRGNRYKMTDEIQRAEPAAPHAKQCQYYSGGRQAAGRRALTARATGSTLLARSSEVIEGPAFRYWRFSDIRRCPRFGSDGVNSGRRPDRPISTRMTRMYGHWPRNNVSATRRRALVRAPMVRVSAAPAARGMATSAENVSAGQRGITRAQWWWAETLFMHSISRPSGAEWLTSPRLRMPTIRLLLFMTGSRRTLSSSMC